MLSKKRNWDVLPSGGWLMAGEIQADPLGDLRPTDGTLSIWELDEGLILLDRVLVALALGRQNWRDMDFGLFDSDLPKQVGILMTATPGATVIPSIDASHRELIELTIDRYSAFVRALFPVMRRERAFEKELKQKTRAAAELAHLDEGRLSRGMRKRMQEL